MGIGIPLLHYACHGAVTEHRDAIGHIKDLVQLMADQNKALSLFGELFNGIQKLLNLKRRQHACWLIQYNDLGALIQHLQYFNATPGRAANGGARVHFHAVFSQSPSTIFTACLRSNPAPEPGSLPITIFSAIVNVGNSMKCWCTMPIPP